MPEPKQVDFQPRWRKNLSPEDEAAFAQFAACGSLPTEPPRIDTRILPRENGYKLSLRSLGEVAELTQKLADYAGYDAIHGPNPDFADLRSVSDDWTKLTRLTSEPFLPGSFLIPACLEANPLEILEPQGRRQIETDAVAQRFGDILTALDNERTPTSVSIGALQTLAALNRILKREAATIEFSTADRFRKPLVTFAIGESFLTKVRQVLDLRRPSQEILETLEGRITALDVLRGTLLLSISGVRNRVRGDFSHMFTPSLLESLNRRVRLQGVVERKVKKPAVIHIHTVETLDAD